MERRQADGAIGWLLAGEAILLALALLFGRLSLPRRGELTASSASVAPLPAIPTVDGEFGELAAAPDCSLLAVQLARQRDNNMQYEVLLFDPERRKIVQRFSEAILPAAHAWSPDSRRLAAFRNRYSAENGDAFSILILGIDGSEIEIPTRDAVCGLLWERPDILLYHTDFMRGRLVRYNVAQRRETVLIRERPIVGLFRVNGKACLAQLHGNPRADAYHYTGVSAMDLAGRRKLFSVPFIDRWMEGCDEFLLDVSPDGRYFYLACGASGGARVMIAAVEDAGEVMRTPRYAVMLHGGIRGGEPASVRWSPFYGNVSGGAGERAMIGTHLVDLMTGNDVSLSDWPYFMGQPRGIDWWKGPDRFLYAGERGLLMSGREDGDVLLRSSPGSKP